MLSVQCKFHGNRGLGARRRTRISALGTCNGWLATSHPGLRPAGHSTGKLPCKFSSSPPVLSPCPSEPLLCSVHTTQTAGRFRRETRQSQTPSCQLSTLVGFGSRLSSSRWPAACSCSAATAARSCVLDRPALDGQARPPPRRRLCRLLRRRPPPRRPVGGVGPPGGVRRRRRRQAMGGDATNALSRWATRHPSTSATSSVSSTTSALILENDH